MKIAKCAGQWCRQYVALENISGRQKWKNYRIYMNYKDEKNMFLKICGKTQSKDTRKQYKNAITKLENIPTQTT